MARELKNFLIDFITREADLIKHVQQLEEQLQKMIQNRKEEPSSQHVRHKLFFYRITFIFFT